MDYKDYYKILGVEKGATEKDIKAAYRKLARKYHPDLHPNDKDAERRFKEINEANEVLSDKDKREKYDLLGSHWKQGHIPYDDFAQGNSGYSGFQGRTINIEDLGDIFGGKSDFFDTFFGGGRSKSRGFSGFRNLGPQKGEDAEYLLEITLEEALLGSKKTLEFNKEQKCTNCGGGGTLGNMGICTNCHGRGVTSAPRRLTVNIPKGIREGAKIRLSGEGGEGSRGGSSGDLFFKIKYIKNPLYEVKGDDIYGNLNVGIYDAVLGGSVRTATISGPITLKIPHMTQSGKVFRLKGQGFPATNTKAAGDLFLKTMIVIPENLSDKEKELFVQLRDLSQVKK